jgi:hypothetical protein
MGKTSGQFLANPADLKEKVILINIGREWKPDLPPDELYERTRRWWVVDPNKHPAEYGVAVALGIIRQVYRIDDWSKHDLRTTTESSPTRKLDETKKLPKQHFRWEFCGAVALEMQHYIGMSVAHYRKRGAQNPILYVNC